MVRTSFLCNILLCAFSALVLASSSPRWERAIFPDPFSFGVFFYWALLCSTSRFPSCCFWCLWLRGGMWCERHDRMETSRSPRLVHAIASVLFCLFVRRHSHERCILSSKTSHAELGVRVFDGVERYIIIIIQVDIFVAFDSIFFSVARLFRVRKYFVLLSTSIILRLYRVFSSRHDV